MLSHDCIDVQIMKIESNGGQGNPGKEYSMTYLGEEEMAYWVVEVRVVVLELRQVVHNVLIVVILIHVVRYFLNKFVFRVRTHYYLLSEVVEPFYLVYQFGWLFAWRLFSNKIFGFLSLCFSLFLILHLVLLFCVLDGVLWVRVLE